MTAAQGRLAACVALALTAGCGDDSPTRDDAGVPTPDELAELRGASRSRIVVARGPAGTISTLAATLPTSGATPEDRARGFLTTHGALFGIDDADAELETDGVHPMPGAGATTVVFERRRDGIPVFGAGIRVTMLDGGDLIAVANDDPGTGRPMTTTPTVTSSEAQAAAIEQLGLTELAPRTTEPALVLLSAAMLLHAAGDLELAWMLDVLGPRADLERRCFVDASTGELVFSYALAASDLQRRVFDAGAMHDQQQIRMTVLAPVIDELGEAPGLEIPEEARAAFAGAQRIDDYFRVTFGMNHYSGAEMTLDTDLFVRFDFREDAGACAAMPPLCASMDRVCEAQRCLASASNAFWSGGTRALWFTPGMVQVARDAPVAIDVLGHEWTHAITQHHSGLVYAGEPGALDESISDTFAAFVEPEAPWTIGDHSAVGVIRDMANPGLHGQPAHYDDRAPVPDVGACQAMSPRCPVPAGSAPGTMRTCISGRCYDTTDDDGAVHTNSGVPNHATYLMVEGGAGVGSDAAVLVRGLGQDRTERIYFAALGGRLLSRFTRFSGLRFGLETACRAIVAREAPGETIGPRDCGAVSNAFAAVGVDEPDFDEDGYHDDFDLCPRDYDPEQRDADADGLGDACDTPSGLDGGGPASDAGAQCTPLPAATECSAAFRVECPERFVDGRGRTRCRTDDNGCARDGGGGMLVSSCNYAGLLEELGDDYFAGLQVHVSDRTGGAPHCVPAMTPTTNRFYDLDRRVVGIYSGNDSAVADPAREALLRVMMATAAPHAAPCEPPPACPATIDDGMVRWDLAPHSRYDPVVSRGAPVHSFVACAYTAPMAGLTIDVRWAQEPGESVACLTGTYDGGRRIVPSASRQAVLRLSMWLGGTRDDAVASALGGLLAEVEGRALPCP